MNIEQLQINYFPTLQLSLEMPSKLFFKGQQMPKVIMEIKNTTADINFLDIKEYSVVIKKLKRFFFK